MKKTFSGIVWLAIFLTACQPAPAVSNPSKFNVLAVETFLADIAQNVSGNHLQIASLVPPGVDPHSFELTPQDIARISSSDLILSNGAGLESWMQNALANNANPQAIIEVSKGLVNRTPKPGEVAPSNLVSSTGQVIDPHFWLNPVDVITYVQNILDAFSTLDPANATDYSSNANAYIAKLKTLDLWIQTQIDQIPKAQRLLVTNHETFGYFADQYGFTIVGAIIPSTSTDSTPSAQQLAALVTLIKKDKVKAIFLEAGSNPQLANQVALETNVKVVNDLYTHSTSPAGGPAASYIDMLTFDVNAIVDALK
jgi:ABC-type Zn uptake system ZnuABC Zn-binding protein ZnuA